jgi:hypothetical protein
MREEAKTSGQNYLRADVSASAICGPSVLFVDFT